jgi:hypothetical protein
VSEGTLMKKGRGTKVGASPKPRRTVPRSPLILAIATLLSLASPSLADAQTVVSCPFFGTGGDLTDRGFYVTNYPGTNIGQVTLAYGTFSAGTYGITLTARAGTYDGPIIGSRTVVVLLTGNSPSTPVSFDFGGAPVTQGSTITFTQSSVGGALFDTGIGPCPGVTETEGTIPPLDTFRRDSVGLMITQAPPPSARPSNAFSFGKLKRNKKKGTAKLPVTVPGAGNLTLTGKGVVNQRSASASASRAVSAAGAVKLLVKSKGKKKRTLDRTGTVKVKAKVTYTPTGGDPNTKSKRVKLIKRL